jgi:hypothetical protein
LEAHSGRKVDERMLRRAKLGVGTLVVGTALALVSAATLTLALPPEARASAAIAKSSLCKAYTAQTKQQEEGSAALGKEMALPDWPSAKKAVLATFDKEANTERKFATMLNGASSKVKAAVKVALQLDDRFRTIIEHSTGLAQFQAAITKAESTPKVAAAEKVLVNYIKGRCT